MKKYFLVIILLFSITSVFSQVKVEKSTDVVVALGRKYYVHTVKTGETLYSLSRVYGVPTDQILLINKQVVENLKVNDVLRIPVVDADYQPVPMTKVTFIEHVVQKKESVYAIAQQYGITQDDIIKNNPQIQNGIKKGMVLKIPVEEQETITASDDLFNYHQIKNGETLALIASQYGITVQDITEFNDNTDNLVTGEILAIPKRTLSDEQIYMLKYNASQTPDFLNIDPNYFEDPNYPPCSKFVYNDTMTFKIAILLPLFISHNNGLSYDALSDSKSAHFFGSSMVFYDYLQGTILALDALKKEGYNLDVHIYDTKADSSTTQTILNKYELRKMDLIFGPVYTKNYGVVKKFADEYKINVISPLSAQQQVIEDNPFVYKIIPSNEEVTKFTANYLVRHVDSSLISVIADDTQKQLALADTLKQQIVILSDSTDSLAFQKITFSKFVTPYQEHLSPVKHNYVFITSTDEVQVSAILNNLNALVTVDEFKITVYALPVIENFTRMQADWFVNLDIHYASATVVDKDNWDIKEFKVKYKDIFGRRPSRYSFIAYDATYYFISALKKYGKYFQFCLGDDQEYMDSGMFMKFSFKRLNKTSGFENQRLNMLYYTDNLRIKTDTLQ